jgi:hypothetical protein
MSLDPTYRRSLDQAAESNDLCPSNYLRAALGALDEAEANLDVALTQLLEVKRERDAITRLACHRYDCSVVAVRKAAGLED